MTDTKITPELVREWLADIHRHNEGYYVEEILAGYEDGLRLDVKALAQAYLDAVERERLATDGLKKALNQVNEDYAYERGNNPHYENDEPYASILAKLTPKEPSDAV